MSRLLLNHVDEAGRIPSMPAPSALGSRGTFMVRKLHERVALFRQFLRSNSDSQSSGDLLAAKIVGRWRSGAPPALCPNQDDSALGADPQRNNNFTFADDPLGLKCPRGAHVRRANPRDSLAESSLSDVTHHRCLRRGTSYGPALPEDALEDDGVDVPAPLPGRRRHLTGLQREDFRRLVRQPRVLSNRLRETEPTMTTL